jgi:hypothetical protein
MNIFKYYSLDEVKNKEKVLNKLDTLEEEGKIEFFLDGDIIEIDDIDLDIVETKNLIKLLDDNDVFPYLDREDEDSGSYFDEDFFEDDY